MNGNICILKCVTDILNPGSESMNIRDNNVGSEWVSMCHWSVGLIKINIFNLKTPICTVAGNKFPYIRTVTLLNTRIHEWTKKCFLQRGIWFEWDLKEGWHFCSCHISQIRLLSRILSKNLKNPHECYLVWEVSLGDKIQDVKLQVWLDQIWRQSLQYLFYGSS